jgi:hypothetical protein
MLIRATDTVNSFLSVSVRSENFLEASICGMRLAEDWLIASISSGDVPQIRANGRADPLSRVEALLSDGNGAALCARGRMEAELYVADTDYESGVFRHSASYWEPQTTPGIPRIPVVSDVDGVTRHYYLRSAASGATGARDGAAVIREEVIAVKIDHLGRVSDIRRLFSRSRAEGGGL